MNLIVTAVNVSLLDTDHLLISAEVLLKELVRNKVNSPCTLKHYPI